MLSLPHLPPRDDLWSTSPLRPFSGLADPSSQSNGNGATNLATNNPHHSIIHNGHHHHHQQQNNNNNNLNSNHGPRSSAQAGPNGSRSSSLASYSSTYSSTQLALLIADENTIEQRKLNVRRFGASWLRPPGVAKTYQARMDEELERREQLELQRREEQMMALAAAEEAQRTALTADVMAEDGVEERDLDADVPDADAEDDDDDGDDEEEDDDDDEDDDGDDGDDGDGDEDNDDGEDGEEIEGATSRFNEESLLEGSLIGGDGLVPGQAQSFLDAEDAELDGRAQDLRDLGLERDLDDDVPEAGSYQHTDTEVEDDSEEDDDDNDEEMIEASLASAGPPRRATRRSGARLSTGSEIGLGNSELNINSSSPVAGRGLAVSNAWRDRMMRNRRRRS